MTDLALGLLLHGFTALGRARAAQDPAHADAFPARLLGRRALVVRGPEGVRAFYDETLVARAGVVPPPLAALLFGKGAVHGLDGEEHRRRRSMFVGVLEESSREALVAQVVADLQEATRQWPGRRVQVVDELVEVYGRSVLTWSGVRVDAGQLAPIAHDLADVVDGFGGAGRAYVSAWRARLRADRWDRDQVRAVREGTWSPPSDSPLATVARNPDLDVPTAGVELLNLLRPTVAVAWLGAYAVVALQRSPEVAASLATTATDERHHSFAQEVRRTTPFVPALAGRLLRDTEVAGHRLRRDDRIVLDVWGTNQAAGRWDEPERFTPERFLRDEPGMFDFLPQGGGLPTGHRCPGEPFTVLLLAETVRVLAGVDHRVSSSHDVDLTRMPTMPEHGLLLTP